MRRIVIKVGSSLVTNNGAGLDRDAIASWAGQISRLKGLGSEILLVSSGAIAEGIQRLNLPRRPTALHELQAAAAVGQMGLIEAYEVAFRVHGLRTAQVLLTHEDLANRKRYLNARSALRTLINFGVIPIINENDSVATDEIKLGDNDTLGALVTNLVEADHLIILTDIAGIYDSDPKQSTVATLIANARADDPHLEFVAGGSGSSVGRGGMITKVTAARKASRSGANTIIASGRELNVLERLYSGEAIGTKITADRSPLAARKQWMADQIQLSGRIHLDHGATLAVGSQGKSLLSVGVTAVFGEFERGAIVACIDASGNEFARGLINYGSTEAKLIAGKGSDEFKAILGYIDEFELVHRDNLVLL